MHTHGTDEVLHMHMEGLAKTMDLFGENCLNTAKYYGNLGRLMQTRQQFDFVRFAVGGAFILHRSFIAAFRARECI
jgi:hypothetical protein